MDPAVYLLQNVGDPSDRWINDTLVKSLGLDPQFFDEYLGLVYDGSLVNPKARGNAGRQLCPRARHVWAVLSDEQVMRFNSLETLPATDSAAPVFVSSSEPTQIHVSQNEANPNLILLIGDSPRTA
jgi:hypothetical protein